MYRTKPQHPGSFVKQIHANSKPMKQMRSALNKNRPIFLFRCFKYDRKKKKSQFRSLISIHVWALVEQKSIYWLISVLPSCQIFSSRSELQTIACSDNSCYSNSWEVSLLSEYKDTAIGICHLWAEDVKPCTLQKVSGGRSHLWPSAQLLITWGNVACVNAA